MKKLLFILFSMLLSLQSNAQIQSKGDFEDGRKVGIWTSWNENNQIVLEENFINGHIVSKVTFEYFENGQLESVKNFKENRLFGKSTFWFESGQKKFENNYEKGNQTGKSTSWFENGQKETEQFFSNGIINGKSIRWHENGQKISEINFKNNILHGKSTFWNSSGLKFLEEEFKDGHSVKKTIFKYFENGQLDSVKNYSDNRLNGQATFYWNKNWQKLIEGVYKDNNPDGIWTIWDKKGRKKEELIYRNAALIEKTIFKYSFLKSDQIYEKKYKNGKCVSGDC